MLLSGGRLPFCNENITSLISQIQNEEPDYEFLSSADTHLADLLKKMLSKSPGDRPSASECLKNPWLDTLMLSRSSNQKKPRRVSLFNK